MWKVCLFYSHGNNIFWLPNMAGNICLRNSRGAQRFVGYFSWLCLCWLAEQTNSDHKAEMATTFRYLNMAQLFSCLCTPQEWGGGGRRQTDLALWVWTMAGEIWAPSCTIRLRFLLPCFCHILVLHHSSYSCSGTELSWPSVWGEGEEEEWDSQSLCPRGHCLCQYWRPRNSKHLAREQIMSQRRSLIRSSSRVPCWLTSDTLARPIAFYTRTSCLTEQAELTI